MIQLKNIQTGEVKAVYGLGVKNGIISALAKCPHKGSKFYASNPMVIKVGENAEGCDVVRLADGWEVVKGEKSPKAGKTPKADPQPTPKPMPKEKDEKPMPMNPEPQPQEEQPMPAPAPAPAPEPQPMNADEVGKAIANALKGLKVGAQQVQVDEARVRDIVTEVIEEKMADIEKGKVVTVRIKVADIPEYELKKGTNEKLFKTLMTMVVNDRVIGRFPWLYGPAGSGKSTMAKMVADALGLPFYSVSSLQQKYELEGYSDAVGEFVQTSFYKAMAEGGVFVFDEISTTSGEVQVAFNTAAAQLCYNFPKIGMVDAHPNFHIIACDNSTGRGGDKRYISRFQLDASTLDRYNFLEVGYSPEHDLNMANGDEELVVFMNAVRKALDDANTTYLATPRASKAIKALQALDMTDRDALWFGLCSGWKKQDIRTIAARTNGYNHWFSTFKQIADEI